MVRVRRLISDDWQAFRHIRLHALLTEPSAFGVSYSAAASSTPKNWKTILSQPGPVFGVYDDFKLIGIAAVRIEEKHPKGTAALGMSYLYPEYRGRGFSRLIHQARFEWIVEQGCFDRVVVSHRIGNEESRRSILSVGFCESHIVMSTWPDGSQDEEVWYVLGIEHVRLFLQKQ